MGGSVKWNVFGQNTEPFCGSLATGDEQACAFLITNPSLDILGQGCVRKGIQRKEPMPNQIYADLDAGLAEVCSVSEMIRCGDSTEMGRRALKNKKKKTNAGVRLQNIFVCWNVDCVRQHSGVANGCTGVFVCYLSRLAQIRSPEDRKVMIFGVTLLYEPSIQLHTFMLRKLRNYESF